MRPTSKRAARIASLGVAGLAVVGALLWFLLNDPESQGPLIQGKPVAYWTRQLNSLEQVDRNVIITFANEKSVAIPALVRQLSFPDSAAKDLAKSLWRRLPPMLRERVSEPITGAELRAGAAFALVLVYQEEFVPTQAPSLSEAQIMLPALTSALRDRDANVRILATEALANLGAISEQAIESCDVALRDAHWSVRLTAVNALGRLAKGDERAIPPLKSALSDSRPEVRKRAAEELEDLGITPPPDDASFARRPLYVRQPRSPFLFHLLDSARIKVAERLL